MTVRQRGTSIPEVLTVTVIIGMLLSTMVVIVPLLTKAPLQLQSQVDQVNTTAIALYRIRRDFSEGDTSGIMGCSITPVVSCSTPGPGLTSVQALVVTTAENGLGAFQVDAQGYPDWKGIYVYWLVPNSTGTSFDLMRAFEPVLIPRLNGVPSITSALINPFVTAAMAISPPPVLTNYVASMSVGDTTAPSIIKFRLVAGTTGGVDQTRTNFQSDTYARN